MRDDFTKKTKETLAKRVGYRCSNPKCQKTTSGPNSDIDKSISIGVAAHITAAAPLGPRYDSNLSPEKRKAISNGIWLCQNCATLIDKDTVKFTIEALIRWKEESEKEATNRISGIYADNGKEISHMTFFELLKIQDQILESLYVVKKKTQAGKLLEKTVYRGRNSFKHYYNVFKNPYLKYGKWNKSIPSNTIKIYSKESFFSNVPEMVSYFTFVKEIITFIKNNPQATIYSNTFLAKLDYFEKIMLFYYLHMSEDQEFISLAKELEIFKDLNKSDLIHEESFDFF